MFVLFNTKKFCHKDEVQGEIPGFFKISKDVMKIVWASMLESFLVALVTIFDGIQVAQIGNVASAAVTICRQPYFILVSLAVSLGIALSAIVARRKGQQDIIRANKTVHLGFILAIFLISFFAFPLKKYYIFRVRSLRLLQGSRTQKK